MKNIYSFLIIFLFGYHHTYAQKELWGSLSTSSSYVLPISYNNGAILKTDSIGNNLTVVHVFDSLHGRFCNAKLLQASNGKIYGTTNHGGSANAGILFEYDPIIDSFQVLVNFQTADFVLGNPTGGLLEVSPGLLYGCIGNGAGIYTYSTVTGAIHLVTTLPTFTSGLLTIQAAVSGPLYKASDGYIYGTTGNYSDNPSGSPYVGAVFRIDPSTNVFSFVYPFSYMLANGYGPNGGFVETGGKLYATCSFGGIYDGAVDGVFFSYDMTTHAYTKKIDLSDTTGIEPTVSFLKASNGKFYGYTFYPTGTDAIYKTATLYEYDPATNIYTHKFDFYHNLSSSFLFNIGENPQSYIMQASNGKLYGATERGVFEYDLTTDSMRAAAPFLLGNWQGGLTEICRKPAYKYYSNTSDTACQGAAFAFDLHCANAQTFVWTHNGVIDPTQTSDTLSFSSVTIADSGTWACTLTNQCGTTMPPAIHLTVTSLPSPGVITGAAIVCTGSVITLGDTAAGGTWSSTNTNATVSSGIVSGITAGTDTIQYTVTNTCGAATTTKSITINTSPGSTGSITGTLILCTGDTTTLSDTSSGGLWSSTVPLVASVNAAGTVTAGIAGGTTTISYTVTNSCGTAAATAIVTVNTIPYVAMVAGPEILCVGTPATTYIDSTLSGVWSSSNATIAMVDGSGNVTPLSSGAVIISYSVTNSCGTAVSTKNITVSIAPVAAPITGSTTLCEGDTIHLSDATSGGTWSSSNADIATASTTDTSSSIITGINAGSATISYMVSNTCGSNINTIVITVVTLPIVTGISGMDSLCPGSSITLTDGIVGGIWTSADTSVATISTDGTDGIVTGITAGIVNISYAVTNSCGTTTQFFSVAVYCPRLSVINQVNNTGITIFPNPTENSITIEGIVPASVHIVNMNGQLVKEQKNASIISISELPSGVYFIELYNDKNVMISNGRIIKL